MLHLGEHHHRRRGNLIEVDIRETLALALPGHSVHDHERRKQRDALIAHLVDVFQHAGEARDARGLHDQVLGVQRVGYGEHGRGEVLLARAADAVLGGLPDGELVGLREDLGVDVRLAVLVLVHHEVAPGAPGELLDERRLSGPEEAGHHQHAHATPNLKRRRFWARRFSHMLASPCAGPHSAASVPA